jgi:uncharacterized membrane protein YhiD involved in acid resistance
MINIISWIVPKNKFLSGSTSLTARIGVAICIQTLGFADFFTILFRKLGINMMQGTERWLQQKDKCHEKKKDKAKDLSSKRKCKDKHYRKVQEKTVEARADMRKGTGYYKGAVIEPELTEPEEPTGKKVRGTCKCGSITQM